MRLSWVLSVVLGLTVFGCSSGEDGAGGSAGSGGAGGIAGGGGAGGRAGGGGEAGSGGAGDPNCTKDEDCDADEQCFYGDGCNRFGECRTKPTRCAIAVGDPEVCGCDGQTYENASCAEMLSGGVGFVGTCNCQVHVDCDVPDEYCFKTEGCLLGGTCTEKPALCRIPPIPTPVCGCDSHTYDSECLAALAGASVRHPGECPEVCLDNSDCFLEMYCDDDESCDSHGVCIPRPALCGVPPIPSHVCGCDGRTYESACFAAMAGVRVQATGMCP
jgi:hypothetical protein